MEQGRLTVRWAWLDGSVSAARRPKVRRLVGDRRLAREVAKRLKKKHSPERDTPIVCALSIPMSHTGGCLTR